jgi:Holliday junction resolvasome RuvABC endonuclease subunit
MPTVLALDAGLSNLGIAVFEYTDQDWQLAALEVRSTKGIPKAELKKMKGISASDDMARRIRELCEDIEYLFAEYEPDLIVAELPTGGARDSNAIKGMAVGLTIVVATSQFYKIPLIHVTPRNVKITATGSPEASKEEIENIVGEKYPELCEGFKSSRAASGWSGKFEHAADAVMTFHAAQHVDEIKHLEFE